MIQPERLAESLRQTSVAVERDGPLTWERCADWTTARMPAHREPLDDEGEERVRAGRTEEDEENYRMDAAAARYEAELAKITARMISDGERLRTIMSIANPSPPKNLATRDMLVAQVEADGWCGSCWRDDQHLTPVAERPNGQPYYRGRCRFCGEWKANTREDPPLDVLRPHHEGRRIRVRA